MEGDDIRHYYMEFDIVYMSLMAVYVRYLGDGMEAVTARLVTSSHPPAHHLTSNIIFNDRSYVYMPVGIQYHTDTLLNYSVAQRPQHEKS